MKTQTIVKELESVAKQLGVGIRKGKGSFRGGRCMVGGNDMIVLNKHHVPEVHLTILAEGLRGLPVESIPIKPAVKKALEQAWHGLEALASDSENKDVN